jgi:hypothetical protein
MDHSEVKHLPKVDYTPAELDNVSRLLLKAAGLIEQHGLWCGGDAPGRCVLGAIVEAEGHSSVLGKTGREAFGRVQNAIGVKSSSAVFKWNDANNKDGVVAKLRAVALGL